MTVYMVPEHADAVDHGLTVHDEECMVGQSILSGINYTSLTTLKPKMK
jgi:hypothetical protein